MVKLDEKIREREGQLVLDYWVDYTGAFRRTSEQATRRAQHQAGMRYRAGKQALVQAVEQIVRGSGYGWALNQPMELRDGN